VFWWKDRAVLVRCYLHYVEESGGGGSRSTSLVEESGRAPGACESFCGRIGRATSVACFYYVEDRGRGAIWGAGFFRWKTGTSKISF
jgi:hypothetical protein